MTARQLGIGIVLVAALLGAVVTLVPYFDPDLPAPTPSEVEWTSYANEKLGFTVEIPKSYEPEVSEDGARVVFHYRGSGIVQVVWTDAEDARARGLWAKHDPVAETKLGGRAGKKYVYNHFDAFAGVRTYSHVVPHRERFLALEFRTQRASALEHLGFSPRKERKPDEVCERIRRSFRIKDG